MLCTRSYRVFNKLHDKKHHHYKPIPLITSYLLTPEQPSPFGTMGALITSTWWPKKSLHDTELCNYTSQKYSSILGDLHLFWCCHPTPALQLTRAVLLYLGFVFFVYIFLK